MPSRTLPADLPPELVVRIAWDLETGWYADELVLFDLPTTYPARRSYQATACIGCAPSPSTLGIDVAMPSVRPTRRAHRTLTALSRLSPSGTLHAQAPAKTRNLSPCVRSPLACSGSMPPVPGRSDSYGRVHLVLTTRPRPAYHWRVSKLPALSVRTHTPASPCCRDCHARGWEGAEKKVRLGSRAQTERRRPAIHMDAERLQ